jgi:hypothetical protein
MGYLSRQLQAAIGGQANQGNYLGPFGHFRTCQDPSTVQIPGPPNRLMVTGTIGIANDLLFGRKVSQIMLTIFKIPDPGGA